MSETYNILVAQSGGPTSAINASLAGVIRAGRACKEIGTIYGAINGIEGVLERDLVDLTELLGEDDSVLDVLKISPAMYLGSCRYKLEEPEKAVNQLIPEYERIDDYTCIFNILTDYDIRYFFYIGGNDSMDTVMKLGKFGRLIDSPIRFIGIPKTIDNDLPVTDHTPGYGSAARFVATSMMEMAYDTSIYSIKSVLIVEIMGRDAGWLTAASALARTSFSEAPHLIYLPEVDFSDSQFLVDLRGKLKDHEHVIVAVSEGVHYADGTYVSMHSAQKDQFGHTMLSGAGGYLASLVHRKIGCKVRSVELNVLQRCAAHVSSLTDLNEAEELGKRAVYGAIEGRSEQLIYLKRLETEDGSYQVEYDFADVAEAANKEKKMPLSMIAPGGNDITEEFLKYVRPLIQGEPTIEYQYGIPVYLSIKHLKV